MGGFPTTAFLAGRRTAHRGGLPRRGRDAAGARIGPADVGRQGTFGGPGSPRATPPTSPPGGADGRDREPPRRPDRGQVRRGARRLGSDAKFPLPRTIEFALKRDRGRALRTLDAVRDHLADDVAGGFFRFAGTPDWGDVAYEKPIDTNAAVTRAFANAYSTRGDEAYLAPATDAVDFLTDGLWTGYGVGGSVGPARTRLLRRLRRGPRRTRPASPGPDRLRGRERSRRPTHCSRSPPTPTTSARASTPSGSSTGSNAT